MAYDIVNSILNAARVRVMDELPTLQPIGGQILDRSQPWVQEATNIAWRRLQECLADLGYVRLEDEKILHLPGVTNLDPGAFITLSWTSSPALPDDLITPLQLWERPTSSGVSFQFGEMDKCLNGLPATTKGPWNINWAWQTDTLVLPGAVVNLDLRIRYVAYLADFLDAVLDVSTGQYIPQIGGTMPWFMLPVPINRCKDAFSLFLCAELAAAAKQPELAAVLISDAEDKCKQIADRETVKLKQPRKVSEYGRMKDQRTSGADVA